MHFQIHRNKGLTAVPPHERIYYTWTLEKKDGPVCQSAVIFDTEAEARGHVAAAKKTFAGVSRTRVQSPVGS